MITEIVFWGIVSLTLLGGFLAVSLKNVFYNALSLILCLFGVAGLFIYLNSEFLAIMEIIIYIGAIAIAIIFAIMLSQPMFQKSEKKDPWKLFKSFVISALFFGGLWMILKSTQWPAADVQGDYSIRAIGKSLLTYALLPFEAVSLVLLVAIIGALLISSSREIS
jgi:NADH-quinone oxidoreductase subunit J